MDQNERTLKDLEKLDRILAVAQKLGYDKKYPEVFGHAVNYRKDAKHFFEQGDYFTAFGAANYAYGFIDAILVIEGKKDENIL